MAFLIAVITFISILLIVLSMFVFLRQMEERMAIENKVANFSGGEEVPSMMDDSPKLPEQPLAKMFVRVIRYFGNLLKPQKKEELSLIQKRFWRAGFRKRNALVLFFGSKALCAICLSVGFIAAILLFHVKISIPLAILLVVLCSLYGFFLPNLWLAWKTSRRKDDIMRGFPDALDLLAVCVEAGMGLDGGIKRVGEEMRFSNRSISEEFRILNLEMRAGKERKDAMRSMADRIDLEDVSSWVTLLIQTDKLGTSIAQALRVQSDSLRIKRTQRLEELAAKVPVKLLFPTIFLIFPSIFVAILGPAVIRILKVMSQH